MTILYVSPWTGEFGWEVGWWNPLIRGLARQYDQVIVACRSTSIYLYEYATKIIEIPAQTTVTFNDHLERLLYKLPADWGHKGEQVEPKILYAYYKPTGHLTSVLDGRNLSLGTTSDKHVDIMCNFRKGEQKKKQKEYPLELCDALVRLLTQSGYSIGCFGGLTDYCPNETIDFRNNSLAEQCAILGTAKCAIGHSSGAMHLASFCRCPHIIWHVERIGLNPESLIRRYQNDWNPLATPIRYIPDAVPSPESVVETIKGFINNIAIING